jgi:tetratricopeptide (TPR) repeat protein
VYFSLKEHLHIVKNMPTLELVMIVKNAETVIANTLNAIKSYIYSYTILDTGSTDKTISIMKEILKDNKGMIYEEPFVDFSTSRNRVLELAGTKCDYVIMLDDSFVVKNPEQLNKILKLNYDMYFITVDTVGELYHSNRMFKTSKNFKYIYKIHEYIDFSEDNTNIYFIDKTQIYILDIKDSYATARTKERLIKDLELFDEEIKTNPQNRSYFYKGATYLALSLDEKAEECLKKVTENKTIDQFTYMAFDQLATLYAKHGRKWDDIEPIYKYLIVLKPDHAEPYYFISLYYYNKSDYVTAYHYLSKAYELKIPSDTSSSIEKIYNIQIPYLFADVLVHLGQVSKATKILNQLRHSDPNISEVNSLLEQLKNRKEDVREIKVKKSNQKILVIHTGAIKFIWNPKNIHKNASGSEFMACLIAYEMNRRGWGVFIFGSFVGPNEDYQTVINNVTFKSEAYYNQFIKEHYIDVLLISRFACNLKYLPNIDKVFLWLHDIEPQEDVFHTHPTKFKGVICLTQWHLNHFSNIYRFPNNLTHIIGNVIDIQRFKNVDFIKKIPYRFIYTSSPDRGLDNLFDMFPSIVNKYPSAELHVFAKLRTNMKIPKNVIIHERVDQQTLADEICKSDVWLYPTNFTETFCITALEMQAGKVLCVSTNLAALSEIVADRGVLVDGNGNEKEVRDLLLQKLFFILEQPKLKNFLIEKAHKWALHQNISKAGDMFEKLFLI